MKTKYCDFAILRHWNIAREIRRSTTIRVPGPSHSLIVAVFALVVSLASLFGSGGSCVAQCCPPVITNQPQSQSVVVGSAVNFSVGVSSATSPNYQWRFNGANIAGATGTNYGILNVQPVNAGNYSVAVTNQAGWTISSNASLTVTVPSSVQFTFSAYSVGERDGSVVIAVSRTGDPSGAAYVHYSTADATAFAGTDYQSALGLLTWDNGDLATKTFAVTVIDKSVFGSSNYFTVSLSGPSGVSLGNPGSATVTIIQPPLITAQPQNLSVTQGANATLNVAAEGYGPLSYMWYYNGTVIAGATNSTYSISNVQARQAGTYSAEVANAAGSVPSEDALLTVSLDPGRVIAWGDDTYGQSTVPPSSPGFTGSQIFNTSGNTGPMEMICGVIGGASQWIKYIPPVSGVLFLNTDGSSYDTVMAVFRPSPTNPAVLVLVACDDNSGVNGISSALSIPVSAGQTNWIEVDGVNGATGILQYNWKLVPNFVDGIAAGSYHSLALATDGTVKAWGYNNQGQSSVPAGLTNVAAIAGGNTFSLVLKNSGTVTAWGTNSLGPTAGPSTLSNAIAIASGAYHSLALKSNGIVSAWGANANGQINVPTNLSNVVAVAAGELHSVALKSDGTVTVWGDFLGGQTNVPPGLNDVVAVTAGGNHSLALKGDGTVAVWGDMTDVPAGASNVVAVAAGRHHCLILTGDGSVLAWGDNSAGQTNVPVGLTNIVAIAAGFYHSLALQGDGAPAITVQPASRVANPGDNITLTVMVAGVGPLGYQWRFNGTNLSGATDFRYALVNAQPSNSGNYSVIVGNSQGIVTSSNALLIVDSTVRLSSGMFTANGFQLHVSGPAGIYSLQASINLANWLLISTTNSPGGMLDFNDQDATNFPRRFYRVLVQ